MYLFFTGKQREYGEVIQSKWKYLEFCGVIYFIRPVFFLSSYIFVFCFIRKLV